MRKTKTTKKTRAKTESKPKTKARPKARAQAKPAPKSAPHLALSLDEAAALYREVAGFPLDRSRGDVASIKLKAYLRKLKGGRKAVQAIDEERKRDETPFPDFLSEVLHPFYLAESLAKILEEFDCQTGEAFDIVEESEEFYEHAFVTSHDGGKTDGCLHCIGVYALYLLRRLPDHLRPSPIATTESVANDLKPVDLAKTDDFNIDDWKNVDRLVRFHKNTYDRAVRRVREVKDEGRIFFVRGPLTVIESESDIAESAAQPPEPGALTPCIRRRSRG